MRESVSTSTGIAAGKVQRPDLDRDVDVIIKRIRTGDREAFQGIIDIYRGLLIAIAYNYVDDFDTAQEIAQVALVRCYFEILKNGNLKIKPWLMKVVKNLCIDWKRLAQRRTLSLDEIKDSGKEPAARKRWRPDTEIMRKEQHEQIQRAFDSLPAEQRRAMVLKYVQELTYEDIASIMGVSLTKLKSLLYRARVSFRKKLQEQEGESV